MKVLVTGGAGYIGGVCTRQLLAAGHDVTVLDNLGHGRRENVPAAAHFVQADTADAAAVAQALSAHAPEAVLHFAALIEAGESMHRPGDYFSNNTAATAILLRCIAEAGIRKFVFSSTAAVFGNPETVPIEEDARKQPTNVYGETKLLTEHMLPWFGQANGLRYAVLRYFNVAGALPDYGEAHKPETHLIPLVLDVALGLRPHIKIFGNDYDTEDGTCIRDYIHVADISRAHLLALDALEQREAMTYNLGNGRGFSVQQVIDAARRVTGHAIPAVIEPRRAGDPARLIASSEKIQRELGWRPEIPNLDDIVASAWAWHQQRFGNKQ